MSAKPKQLLSLPTLVQRRILSMCSADVAVVCQCAKSCQELNTAVQDEGLWKFLFSFAYGAHATRWTATQFPSTKSGGNSSLTGWRRQYRDRVVAGRTRKQGLCKCTVVHYDLPPNLSHLPAEEQAKACEFFITAVCLDGIYLCTADHVGRVLVWNLESGDRHRVGTPAGTGKQINCMCVCAVTGHVLVGNTNKHALLYQLNAGTPLKGTLGEMAASQKECTEADEGFPPIQSFDHHKLADRDVGGGARVSLQENAYTPDAVALVSAKRIGREESLGMRVLTLAQGQMGDLPIHQGVSILWCAETGEVIETFTGALSEQGGVMAVCVHPLAAGSDPLEYPAGSWVDIKDVFTLDTLARFYLDIDPITFMVFSWLHTNEYAPEERIQGAQLMVGSYNDPQGDQLYGTDRAEWYFFRLEELRFPPAKPRWCAAESVSMPRQRPHVSKDKPMPKPPLEKYMAPQRMSKGKLRDSEDIDLWSFQNFRHSHMVITARDAPEVRVHTFSRFLHLG